MIISIDFFFKKAFDKIQHLLMKTNKFSANQKEKGTSSVSQRASTKTLQLTS